MSKIKNRLILSLTEQLQLVKLCLSHFVQIQKEELHEILSCPYGRDYDLGISNYFGGIDKYFTPFIASKKMNRREINEILPEHNQGFAVVPQILTNRADEFLAITKRIADYGYNGNRVACTSEIFK